MTRSILVPLGVAVAIGALVVAGAAGAARAKPSPSSWPHGSARVGSGRVIVRHGTARHIRVSVRARRILQDMNGNGVECSGTVMFDTPDQQTCVITPSDGSNATCVEQTDSPTAVQTCDITQSNTTTDNQATIIQIAATDNGSPTQDHTQDVNLRQTNDTGSNDANITQVIKQSLGPGHFDDTDTGEADTATTSSPTPITTSQESHQTVSVMQTATLSGDNNSSISQTSKQRVRALHAPMISESQNVAPRDTCPVTDDTKANQCSLVNQTSTSGQNVSTLDNDYSQFERAHDTTATGTQQQGISAVSGGIDHEIHQTSSGFCKIVTNQDETQTERAVQASETQIQHGPIRKGAGSSQGCASNSTWNGTQDSDQLATTRPTEADIGTAVFGDPAFQDDMVEYIGNTTGTIQANQSVKEQTNGHPAMAQNSCGPSTTCAIAIACGETDASIAGAPPTQAGTCVPFNEGDDFSAPVP